MSALTSDTIIMRFRDCVQVGGSGGTGGTSCRCPGHLAASRWRHRRHGPLVLRTCRVSLPREKPATTPVWFLARPLAGFPARVLTNSLLRSLAMFPVRVLASTSAGSLASFSVGFLMSELPPLAHRCPALDVVDLGPVPVVNVRCHLQVLPFLLDGLACLVVCHPDVAASLCQSGIVSWYKDQ